ncbi:MAG: ribonuclease Z [Proteobacteria bacterium]|nr:ribonuclease Z [Pseudomonadota bacterium]
MFSAYLINDPFGDPGVYVGFKYRNSAILFDLGDLHSMPPRKLLKISHIFVSHTHMDHFIGFDHLLRVLLGRDKHLSLFGPPGFIENVESKIAGYTWNLVENYTNDFVLLVTEVHPEHKITRRYRCQEAFKPEIVGDSESFDGTIMEENFFTVKGVFLDHKIPCLAYSLKEKQRINIKRNRLDEMGLPVGAWLMGLKESIMRGDPDDTPIRVWRRHDGKDVLEKILPLGELRENIVKITPGQKITYIADAVYSEENARRIVELAHMSEVLFIEACFLEEDAEKAAEKYHLTAMQAGDLARRAGAKRMTVFHFSPKYKGCGELLVDEAVGAFLGEGGKRKSENE